MRPAVTLYDWQVDLAGTPNGIWDPVLLSWFPAIQTRVPWKVYELLTGLLITQLSPNFGEVKGLNSTTCY